MLKNFPDINSRFKFWQKTCTGIASEMIELEAQE